MKIARKTRTVLQGLALISLLTFIPFIQAQTAPPTWTQLFPVGSPVGREGHSAVYDAANNRMIVFGGRNGVSGPLLNDVWVLSNANGVGASPSWTPITTSGGPSPREFHSAVYDSASNRMIVFGGEPSYNDVWVLSNANGLGVAPAWTQLVPTSAIPSPRLGHSAVYDEASNRMIIFGGEQSFGFYSVILDDAWVLLNANGSGGPPSWMQLSPTGAIGAREMHSAVYDSANNRMTVFGGSGNFALLHDVWVLSNANGRGVLPAAWTQLAPTGAIAGRDLHSAVYDSANNRMTVFGGIANFALANDVWDLSNANGLGGAPAWTQLTPSGGPNGRWGHSTIYHSATGRMIVFGGFTSLGPVNDIWVLSNGATDLTVQIIISPMKHSRPPTIELDSEDLIVVAILSNGTTFNALTMVNRDKLTFGRTGNEASLAYCYDSNAKWARQMRSVLLCKFYPQKTGLQPGDTMGVLKGTTTSNISFKGTDSLRIRVESDDNDDNHENNPMEDER